VIETTRDLGNPTGLSDRARRQGAAAGRLPTAARFKPATAQPRTSSRTCSTRSGTATSVFSPLWRSPHLDDAVGEVPADHDDGRDADQLGVLELHAGRDAAHAVVVQDPHAARAEFPRRSGSRSRRSPGPCRRPRCARRPGPPRAARPGRARRTSARPRPRRRGRRRRRSCPWSRGPACRPCRGRRAWRRRRTCGRAGRCGRSRCRGRWTARGRSAGHRSPARTSAASTVPSMSKSRPATA